VLHAKIVYLTKKSNNTLQLQTSISFKMELIKFELHIKLFNASHASLVFENTQLHRNITISRLFLFNYTKMVI